MFGLQIINVMNQSHPFPIYPGGRFDSEPRPVNFIVSIKITVNIPLSEYNQQLQAAFANHTENPSLSWTENPVSVNAKIEEGTYAPSEVDTAHGKIENIPKNEKKSNHNDFRGINIEEQKVGDMLEQVEDQPPRQPDRPEGEVDGKRIGCRCEKSKCLRLHCRCFRDLQYCATICKCLDCFNVLKHENARQFIIKATQDINQNAFKTKFLFIDREEKEVVNRMGCFCKTGCTRNYCDCFKNGIGCSPICRCAACLNQKVDIPSSEEKAIPHIASRKKVKIVIENDQAQDQICVKTNSYRYRKNRHLKIVQTDVPEEAELGRRPGLSPTESLPDIK
jgi:hypothetical protein